MDNLCHSLAGAALASAGLNRRTAFAATTLVIGANLPDVDALVYFFADGTSALAFRRGWTHGVLAMGLLPVLLSGGIVGIGRVVERRRARRSGIPADRRVRPAQVLLLAALAVWSHPLLDLFNTYGVRLLMPFSNRWFYGDTLFIIDPWMWLALGVGAAASAGRSRRLALSRNPDWVATRSERPARIGLALAAAYVIVMAVSSAAARGVVEAQASAQGSAPARRVMVSPAPGTPFSRSVVRDLGDAYEVGRLTWAPQPAYAASGGLIPKRLDAQVARVAARSAPGRRFFTWARFPFAETDTVPGGIAVHFRDLRYASPGNDSWAAVTVVVPPSTGAP